MLVWVLGVGLGLAVEIGFGVKVRLGMRVGLVLGLGVGHGLGSGVRVSEIKYMVAGGSERVATRVANVLFLIVRRKHLE